MCVWILIYDILFFFFFLRNIGSVWWNPPRLHSLRSFCVELECSLKTRNSPQVWMRTIVCPYVPCNGPRMCPSAQMGQAPDHNRCSTKRTGWMTRKAVHFKLQALVKMFFQGLGPSVYSACTVIIWVGWQIIEGDVSLAQIIRYSQPLVANQWYDPIFKKKIKKAPIKRVTVTALSLFVSSLRVNSTRIVWFHNWPVCPCELQEGF